jgi:preprotein translocase subunit SecG
MTTVVLVIHLFIALALVGVVLMQKSEGGALGIGGGGGGGLLTGRGTANLLSRATAILAAAFFVTSIVLTILAQRTTAPRSVFDTPTAGAPAAPGAATTGPDGKPADAPAAPAGRGGVLDRLQGTTPAPATPAAPSGPAVPQTR